MGKALDVSPRKIDRAVRVFGGTMSAQTVNMLNFLKSGKAAEPTRRVSDNQLIRPYTANSTSLAGSANRFYDIAGQLEHEYNGARKERGSPPTMAKDFMNRREDMGKAWKVIAAIREHPTMPPDEKRKRMNMLNKKAIEIAENGLSGWLLWWLKITPLRRSFCAI